LVVSKLCCPELAHVLGGQIGAQEVLDMLGNAGSGLRPRWHWYSDADGGRSQNTLQLSEEGLLLQLLIWLIQKTGGVRNWPGILHITVRRCSLPQDFLLSPIVTCFLPRLHTASHDSLLLPTTTCCLHLIPRRDCLEKSLRHLALGCFYSVVTAQKGMMNV
jgi:hypothetical protein